MKISQWQPAALNTAGHDNRLFRHVSAQWMGGNLTSRILPTAGKGRHPGKISRTLCVSSYMADQLKGRNPSAFFFRKSLIVCKRGLVISTFK